MAGLEEGVVISRLRALDLDAVSETVGALRHAAHELFEMSSDLARVVEQLPNYWRSDDATAAVETLRSCRDGLQRGATAVEDTGAALDRLALPVQEARSHLLLFDRALSDAYRDPESALTASDAQLHLDRAESLYHDTERMIRTILWELGDSAPVGPAPDALLPIVPRQSWWERLLIGSTGFYSWRKGRDGQFVGLDEDGQVVPAHRGHAYFVETKQGGIGGLFQSITRIGRRLKIGPGASLADLTRAFSDDIVKTWAWRPGHINRHIREWFNLPKGAPVTPWMHDEFLRKVSIAAARSGKVIPGRLAKKPTHAVLHFDLETKRFLVVHFHASGPRAGEFASAFIPKPSQLDELLRRAATVKGV